MGKVTRNNCLYCQETGAPDSCLHRKDEGQQARLGGFE